MHPAWILWMRIPVAQLAMTIQHDLAILYIYMNMSYLQNSIAPKWNIYFSFVLKGHLRFTRVSTKPSQIYVRYRAVIISS